MVSGKEKYQVFLMVLFSEMSNCCCNPSHVLFYCPKNLHYTWDLWNIVFVRVRTLGHWGKKIMYGIFKYKPCNRKRSRWMLRGKTWGKKYWRKHKPISDAICGDLRGRKHSFYKNWAILKIKKKLPLLCNVCVCVSVWLLSLTPFILRVPLDPAGAGPRQEPIGIMRK